MQCFGTLRGFLHKIYAATMDGKGRQGTYNFFSLRPGMGVAEGQGTWGQLPPVTQVITNRVTCLLST